MNKLIDIRKIPAKIKFNWYNYGGMLVACVFSTTSNNPIGSLPIITNQISAFCRKSNWLHTSQSNIFS